MSHREGSVPAAVQSARIRNLAVAFLLLALIAMAGAALVRHTRQARGLAAAQFQFFAGTSHELRTPLTVIQGAGHNLLSGVVKDEAQRESYVQAIVKESTQLNEMVDQLLSYGVESKAQTPVDPGTVFLDVALSEAIESDASELEKDRKGRDLWHSPRQDLRQNRTTARSE